jgi:quercetin dioxygenase-like cupin family protein
VPVIVTSEGRPRGLNVSAEQITVLADGAATGSYEIFHQAGPEGSGPPPHSHPWDEAFYVIAGQVSFGIDDDQDLLAPPGTLVHIPAGSDALVPVRPRRRRNDLDDVTRGAPC